MHSLPQGAIAYREAGLPNIWGQFAAKSHSYDIGWPAKGAFYATVFGNGPKGVLGTNIECAWKFDASRCSPVYGLSTTVQPSAVAVNYFIKAR